jgi:CheY-like chemotaxis protein
MIRTLIADNDVKMRDRLASLLASEADVEGVGYCRDVEETVTSIASLSPDLVFLDVQMPQVDGFGLLRSLTPTPSRSGTSESWSGGSFRRRRRPARSSTRTCAPSSTWRQPPRATFTW